MAVIVNLTHVTTARIFSALEWVSATLGPSGTRWRFIDLNQIEFANDRDADFFILQL